MNKVIIKLDDARDMIMDLNHDQAVKVLPFLQWHINSMQNLKDSGFQIGDRVKGVNTAWKGNGTIIDITHDRVKFKEIQMKRETVRKQSNKLREQITKLHEDMQVIYDRNRDLEKKVSDIQIALLASSKAFSKIKIGDK